MAQILVVKKSGGDMDWGSRGHDNRMAYMVDYMSTQSILLRSPKIIDKAVKLPKMQDLKSFPTETGLELVYGIREAMTVARDSKEGSAGAPTNILSIYYKGPVADECPRIIEGVIESYQTFLNDTYRNVSERTLDLINQAREMLSDKVEKQQQAYQEYRLKNNPFVMFQGQSGSRNIFSERLGKYETQRSELRIKVMQMTDQYLR